MPSPKGASTSEKVINFLPEQPSSISKRKKDRRLPSKYGALGSCCEWFDGELSRNPLLSQLVAVGVLSCLSDLIAQLLEGSLDTGIDLSRTMRFAAFRAAIATPIYLTWLKFMESTVTERVRALGLPAFAAPLLKMCCDQGLYTPAYQIFFYVSLAAAEGQPLINGWQRVVRMLPRTLPIAWLFWCPIQVLNFALAPPRWRVLTVNVANVAWNVAMSLFNEIGRTHTLAAATAATVTALGESGRMGMLEAPSAPPGAVMAAAATAATELAGASIQSQVPVLQAATEQDALIEQEMDDSVLLGRGDGAGSDPEAPRADSVAEPSLRRDDSDGVDDDDDDDDDEATCVDTWPRRWCRRRAAKCWSEWVLVRCARTCGLCDQQLEGPYQT